MELLINNLTTDLRLTAMTLSKFSIGADSIGPESGAPALLIRMSILPNFFTVSVAIFMHVASSVMSPVKTWMCLNFLEI